LLNLQLLQHHYWEESATQKLEIRYSLTSTFRNDDANDVLTRNPNGLTFQTLKPQRYFLQVSHYATESVMKHHLTDTECAR
jgi:hypothetical protein